MKPNSDAARRRLVCAIAALPLLHACSRAEVPRADAVPDVASLHHPDAFWRDKLAPAAFAVLFDDDTEPAFSSPLDREKREGTFICAACRLPLFASEHKYDSGTGWPSFERPLDYAHVATRTDYTHVLPRTEYHCARCAGHQGHVFEDGPPPLGRRWCNNGLALDFVPRGEPLPPLRG